MVLEESFYRFYGVFTMTFGVDFMIRVFFWVGVLESGWKKIVCFFSILLYVILYATLLKQQMLLIPRQDLELLMAFGCGLYVYVAKGVFRHIKPFC